MKQFSTIIIFFTLFSCSSDINNQDVFSEFELSKKTIPADGQSTAEAMVVLNSDTDSDRKNVIFKITNGVFISSATDPSTITVKAAYEEGRLIARTSFKSTTQPGTLSISVQPEFDSPVKEFTQTKAIESTKSEAVSLTLSPSSFGIFSNHLNEVQFIGILRNIDNKQVSNGYKVLFSDKLASGAAANGQFRAILNTSDATSKVSAFYSAALYPVGTKIFITCYLLDSEGNPTLINDQVTLTINQ